MSEERDLAADLSVFDGQHELMKPDGRGGYEIDFEAVALAVLALGYRKAAA